MRQAGYQDLVWQDAVHLDATEAEILRDVHYKNISKWEQKIEKLRDKAEGSTKYDQQISELLHELEYSKSSFDTCLRIIRYYQTKKN